jgi:DNA-binding transcriptional ArsR family regulator
MEEKHVLDRLTSALYRVTDRMDDEEPLKWRLRSCALNLSDLFFKDRESLSIGQEENRSVQMALIFKNINRLLELAGSLSCISRVNFEVLSREYAGLESQIFDKKETVLLDVQPDTEEVMIHGETHRVGDISDRKKKILDFLEKNTGASISSISSLFDNRVSEKTLQRDLGELVLHGFVRAIGERRWRTYSLSDTKSNL